MNNPIHYVTTNSGKFREVQSYAAVAMPNLNLIPYRLETTEIQSLDQQTIALDKAIKAWELLRAPLLVDDAGLFMTKYPDFPGTMSKFIMQCIGFPGLARLIDDGDAAEFVLTMVFIDKNGVPFCFEGRCAGTLIRPPVVQPDNQLPYDAFFVPDGETDTYAQLRNNYEKNRHIFYRGRALQKFIDWYHLYNTER